MIKANFRDCNVAAKSKNQSQNPEALHECQRIQQKQLKLKALLNFAASVEQLKI